MTSGNTKDRRLQLVKTTSGKTEEGGELAVVYVEAAERPIAGEE